MRQPLSSKRQQHGVALIMVLLVVAVIATLATQSNSKIQFNIKKTQNSAQSEQAYWYALGGETIARQLLADSITEDNRSHLEQSWAAASQIYPFEGGELELTITDQQACFNINALTALTTQNDNSPQQSPLLARQFLHLLRLLEFEDQETEQLSATIGDWLDKDLIAKAIDGAEDLHYSALAPPYQSANGPLSQLSELNLVAGFKPEFSARLAPYLCTIANQELKLNINTLSEHQAVIVSALFEEVIGVEEARNVILKRPPEGYASVDEFWQQLAISEDSINPAVKEQLTINSGFFLASIAVNYYDAHIHLNSQLGIKDGQFVSYSRQYGVQR